MNEVDLDGYMMLHDPQLSGFNLIINYLTFFKIDMLGIPWHRRRGVNPSSANVPVEDPPNSPRC